MDDIRPKAQCVIVNFAAIRLIMIYSENTDAPIVMEKNQKT